jgi:hypothetical protein
MFEMMVIVQVIFFMRKFCLIFLPSTLMPSLHDCIKVQLIHMSLKAIQDVVALLVAVDVVTTFA